MVGDEPNRITAELVELDVEPSEVLNVLDPTAVDARLAESIRLPGSLSDLVAPWKEGARAAARATGAVTQAMLAAGGGRYELAAGIRLTLEDVRGPSWSAHQMKLRGGRVEFSAGLEPSVRCTGVAATAVLSNEDIGRRAVGLPIASARVEGDRVEVRPQGRWHPLTFRVWPRLHGGRIALEARELAWRGRSIRLPAPVIRRLTHWLEPPAWWEIDGLTVASGTVSVTGRLEEWTRPISVQTMQQLAQAARRRGQDLVLPGWSAPTD